MDFFADSLQRELNSLKTLSHSPRHVSFLVPVKQNALLGPMAVVHHYRSVHKSMCDLYLWACSREDDNLDLMFLTNNVIQTSSESDNEFNSPRSDFSNETDIKAALAAEK